MKEALIGWFLADQALSALVGTRINWGRRPQGEDLPAVVLFRIGDSPDYALDGPSGLSESRVQADCVGADATSVAAVAGAFKRSANALKGVQAGVEFQGVFIDGERDSFAGEEPERIHATSLDLKVWHSE